MAFMRRHGGETAIVVANADGSHERKVAVRTGAEFFGGERPSWSADGKLIACPAGVIGSGVYYQNVVVIPAEGGKETQLGSGEWIQVRGAAWLADGQGLAVSAVGKMSLNSQIYYVSYPSGGLRRITSDLNSYNDVSATADAKALVTVQHQTAANLWVSPIDKPSEARQLTSGGARQDGDDGLSWTQEGKVVFSSSASGKPEIWIAGADGGSARQLTSGLGLVIDPQACPGGKALLFAAVRETGVHIWRMDTDGGNPRQLTSGTGERDPECSSDGKWVAYVTGNDYPRVWKVPMEGGSPVRMVDKPSTFPAISPDGKRIAYSNLENAVVIVPLEGAGEAQYAGIPASAGKFRWSADGTAILYVKDEAGVSNVWSQPVAGGAPKKLTDFKSDRIFQFDVSRDGKLLALSRGSATNDVVLIRETK